MKAQNCIETPLTAAFRPAEAGCRNIDRSRQTVAMGYSTNGETAGRFSRPMLKLSTLRKLRS